MTATFLATQLAAARTPASDTVDLDGDTWRVLGVGVCRDGYYTCHLASTTRFRVQRNGRVPVQEQAEVPIELVEAALHRPHGFFQWNRALRGAFERGVRDQAAGLSLGACPYVDKRDVSGKLTWSRGFQAAWVNGWEWAERGEK